VGAFGEKGAKKTRVFLSGNFSDAGKEPDVVPAPGAGGRGEAREGRRRAGADGARRGRGGVLHEPVRHARVGREGRHRLRVGRQLGGAVPCPVRVAVQAGEAAGGAAERRPWHGRPHDQRGRHARGAR
jgi:hypothetical protein